MGKVERDIAKDILPFFCEKRILESGKVSLNLLEEIEELYNESQHDLIQTLNSAPIDEASKGLLIKLVLSSNQFSESKKKIYRKRILDSVNDSIRSIKEEIFKYKIEL